MNSGEFWNLLAGSLRLYIISVLGQIIAMYLCRYLLEQRRPIWKLALYLNLKSVFAIFILDIFLRYYFPVKDWVELFGVTTGALLALGSCVMFTYTFKGGFVKCIIGMTIAEVIMSIIMMPCMILANYFGGKEELFVFANHPHPVDLVFIGVELLLGYWIGRLLAPVLDKFKRYDMQHKRLFALAYFIYFFAAQVMTGMDLRSNSVFLFTAFGLYFVCACCIMAAFYFIYWRYQKDIDLKNDFLRLQMRLAEPHYAALRDQVGKLEKCQQLIDEQMKELMRSGDMTDKKRKSAEYLEHLKQEYESIQVGMYCDDWMIDAVLYCQMEAAKNNGISVECALQDLPHEKKMTERIGQILFLLFEFGIEQNKKIAEKRSRRVEVHSGCILNRLTIEFETAVGEKTKFPMQQMKELLRELRGEVTITKTDRKMSVLVTLPG